LHVTSPNANLIFEAPKMHWNHITYPRVPHFSYLEPLPLPNFPQSLTEILMLLRVTSPNANGFSKFFHWQKSSSVDISQWNCAKKVHFTILGESVDLSRPIWLTPLLTGKTIALAPVSFWTHCTGSWISTVVYTVYDAIIAVPTVRIHTLRSVNIFSLASYFVWCHLGLAAWVSCRSEVFQVHWTPGLSVAAVLHHRFLLCNCLVVKISRSAVRGLALDIVRMIAMKLQNVCFCVSPSIDSDITRHTAVLLSLRQMLRTYIQYAGRWSVWSQRVKCGWKVLCAASPRSITFDIRIYLPVDVYAVGQQSVAGHAWLSAVWMCVLQSLDNYFVSSLLKYCH